ncbi:MAG: FtsQ-type POTRA domain-containing protein [Acidimicrobiales bacterium]
MTTTTTRRRSASPAIEPKLQARRIEVARDQGRRRLRRLGVLVLVLLLVVGAVALTQSPALDVDQVQVRGARRTDVAAIRTASGVRAGQSMVGVDPSAAAAQVEALPSVADAQVVRHWPGTVQIVVVERVPVAQVGEGSGAVLVDRSGRALAAAPSSSSLPVLSGRPAAVGQQVSSARQAALAVVADLPRDLRRQVASARVTPTGVALELDDGIEVRWGDTSQATAKAEALRVLLEQADRPTIASVDVSVPRASTLKRQNGGE